MWHPELFWPFLFSLHWQSIFKHKVGKSDVCGVRRWTRGQAVLSICTCNLSSDGSEISQARGKTCARLKRKVRSAAATENKQQQTRRACGHSARERRQQSLRTTVFPHDPFSPPTVWLHKRVLGWQFDSIIPRIRSTSSVIQSAAVFVS